LSRVLSKHEGQVVVSQPELVQLVVELFKYRILTATFRLQVVQVQLVQHFGIVDIRDEGAFCLDYVRLYFHKRLRWAARCAVALVDLCELADMIACRAKIKMCLVKEFAWLRDRESVRLRYRYFFAITDLK
jgi:hypothetical protein